MRATDSVLACRINDHVCALPVEIVAETMRPLPIDGGGAKDPLVAGTTIIRGAPHTVIDGHGLVAAKDGTADLTRNAASDVVGTRLIALRVERARFALAVDSVLGVQSAGIELSPFIDESRSDLVASISAIHPGLLDVLRRARLLADARGGGGPK